MKASVQLAKYYDGHNHLENEYFAVAIIFIASDILSVFSRAVL